MEGRSSSLSDNFEQDLVDYIKPKFGNTRNNIYRNVYKDTYRRMQGITSLLIRWRGSVFKLLWHDFLVYVFAYAVLAVIYRCLLVPYSPQLRQLFELSCIYANRFSNSIPVSFLVGFYVSQVVTRWWDQFMSLPWPDQLALKVVAFIPGNHNFNRNLRRTVMRYVNLSSLLAFRLISEKVKKRFPTYQSLEDAKLMLPHEILRLRKVDQRTPHESSWAPILWAMKLISRARAEGKIHIEAPILANLQSAFEGIETCNRKLLNYGWVNFPLAYTQVATLAVFAYFLSEIFARQFLIPGEASMDKKLFPNTTYISYSSTEPFRDHTPDFFIPIFSMIEFICYMGWIKVAETLLNPFGDDDEDFHVNYLIDRNLQVSYLIVDEVDADLEMAEDPFLEAGIDIPQVFPYNKEAAMKVQSSPMTDGTFLEVPSEQDAASAIKSLGRESMRVIGWNKSINSFRKLIHENRRCPMPCADSTRAHSIITSSARESGNYDEAGQLSQEEEEEEEEEVKGYEMKEKRRKTKADEDVLDSVNTSAQIHIEVGNDVLQLGKSCCATGVEHDSTWLDAPDVNCLHRNSN